MHPQQSTHSEEVAISWVAKMYSAAPDVFFVGVDGQTYQHLQSKGDALHGSVSGYQNHPHLVDPPGSLDPLLPLELAVPVPVEACQA